MAGHQISKAALEALNRHIHVILSSVCGACSHKKRIQIEDVQKILKNLNRKEIEI